MKSDADEAIKQAREAMDRMKEALKKDNLAPQITAGMVVPLHKAFKPVLFFIKGCGNGRGATTWSGKTPFGFFKDKLNSALNPIGFYVLGSASDGAAARVKAQTECCSTTFSDAWTPSVYAVRKGVWTVLDDIVKEACGDNEVKKKEWRKLKGDSAGLQSYWTEFIAGSWCKIDLTFINSVFSDSENPVVRKLKEFMRKSRILDKEVLRDWLRDTSRGLFSSWVAVLLLLMV